MHDVMTPSQMVEMMLDKMSSLDESVDKLRQALHFEAKCERDYRQQRAEAWEKAEAELAPKTLAKKQEDWVDAYCAEARYVRDRAVAESKSWYERVRALRQGLSMLQTASNSIKQEMGFEQTRPGWEGHAL